MDWNPNLRSVPLVPNRPDNPFNFLYNYTYEQYSGKLEMKQAPMGATAHHAMLPTLMDKNTPGSIHNYGGQDPKKKRLSTEQLESLENSFQEEIKLDPDRKMKLSKDLGMQPRQIAVWFQNRRARWKVKQLERLYDALKQEYDAVSRDKHKLQQEVLALRAILKDQTGKKQFSTSYTEVSGEETVESTSIPSSDWPRPPPATVSNHAHQIGDCTYALNVDDYNQVMNMPPPYWAALPSCP